MTQTCEIDCRRRLKVCNERDEIPDCGPPWACARFGSPGHDYQTCDACHMAFQRHFDKNHVGAYR
jgi:hypothetical protein